MNLQLYVLMVKALVYLEQGFIITTTPQMESASAVSETSSASKQT